MSCPIIPIDPVPCVEVAFLAEECYPADTPVNLGIFYNGVYNYGDPIVYAEGDDA